jgi:hypothetical protein
MRVLLGILIIASLMVDVSCVPPPPPPARAMVVPPPPRPDAMWVPGHYQWRRWRHEYVWVPGHYKVRRGGVWVIIE